VLLTAKPTSHGVIIVRVLLTAKPTSHGVILSCVKRLFFRKIVSETRTHLILQPVGTTDSFPEDKAAWARSWAWLWG